MTDRPAPDVVDPRREAVATYLLAEVEIYCSSHDSALRLAGEIIAAIDAAENAELTRLREEVAELRKPDLRTVLAFEAGQAEADALRARVAELEGMLQRLTSYVGRHAMDELIEEGPKIIGWQKTRHLSALLEDCRTALAQRAPTPDPRDARIAELEAALREARDAIQQWGAYAGSYFQDKHDLAGDIAAIDRTLGDRHD